MDQPFKILNTTSLPDSEAMIEVELAAAAVSKFREKAIANLQNAINIPGFRKGHVPEKIIVEKLGEVSILEECVELALPEYYFEILKEGKLEIIGRPQVAITSLVPNAPVTLKITVAIVPKVELPDYKKIAAKVMEVKFEVTAEDKEVDDAILEIRKRMSPKSSSIDPTTKQENVVEDIPELTDELVKKLGEFENIEDFKNKLRDSVLKEKQQREKEKKRLAIMEEILKETKAELPKTLIEVEQDRMMAQFEDNIESMGIKKDEYFKQVGKNETDMKDEWKDEAAKRAKTQLVINTISATEKIEPDTEEIKKEAAHLVEHYKDIDPLRVEAYVETMLLNEKVWQFLEDQK